MTWVFPALLNFRSSNLHLGHVRWGSWLLKMSESIHFSFCAFFIFANVRFDFNPFLMISFSNLLLPILIQVCTKMSMGLAHISQNVVFCLWFCLCGLSTHTHPKLLPNTKLFWRLFSHVSCSIFSNIVPDLSSDCYAIYRDVQVMEEIKKHFCHIFIKMQQSS